MRRARYGPEAGNNAANQYLCGAERDYHEAPEDHKMLYTGESIILDQPLLAEHVNENEPDPFAYPVKPVFEFAQTEQLVEVVQVIEEKPESGY